MAPGRDASLHKGLEPAGRIRSPGTGIPLNEMIYEVTSDTIRATLWYENQQWLLYIPPDLTLKTY